MTLTAVLRLKDTEGQLANKAEMDRGSKERVDNFSIIPVSRRSKVSSRTALQGALTNQARLDSVSTEVKALAVPSGRAGRNNHPQAQPSPLETQLQSFADGTTKALQENSALS